MIRIGEKLYEERIRRGLSLEEVAKATKIRPSFLSAIEKGEYSKLPSGAIIGGFVKNYAEFLKLPKNESAALFRREFNEREFLGVLPEGFTNKDEISLTGLKFGRRAYIFLGVFVLLLFYILFQFKYAFINPPLEVAFPKEGTTQTSPLTISGKTDPNATILIYDLSVSVESNGSFKKQITLFPGQATIQIRSQNRFGKETKIERHIEIRE